MFINQVNCSSFVNQEVWCHEQGTETRLQITCVYYNCKYWKKLKWNEHSDSWAAEHSDAVVNGQVTAKIICLATLCHLSYVCMELFWYELLKSSWLLHVGPEERAGTKTWTGCSGFLLRWIWKKASNRRTVLFSCFEIYGVLFFKQHELAQLPSPRDEVLFISISIYVCFLFQSLETTKAVLMHFDVQTCILLN